MTLVDMIKQILKSFSISGSVLFVGIALIIIVGKIVGVKEKDHNPFVYYSNILYEYVDYVPMGSSKAYHLLPSQDIWSKYGYRYARWALWEFQLKYGNKPLNAALPKIGYLVMVQDNGVIWCNMDGKPTKDIIKVLYE